MTLILQKSTLVKLLTLFLCACFMLIGAKPLYALTPEQKKVYNLGVYYFEPSLSCGATTSGGSIITSKSQEDVARQIIGIAKTYKLGEKGALIGLMAGLAESGLKNYANEKVPFSKQNVAWLALPEPRPLGKDGLSVGIMQQQVGFNWSTEPKNSKAEVDQLMNPAYAAQAFFGSPPGANAPSALKKGLQNKSGWQTGDPAMAAQSVQGSAFSDGSNYKKQQATAQTLLDKYYSGSPEVPLPVSVTGGSTTGGGDVGGSGGCKDQGAVTCTDDSAVNSSLSAVRRSVVCLANKELALWTSKELKPGTGYLKYSEDNQENWCADFTSWLYKQAGYPLRKGSAWRVPLVDDQMAIGQKGGKFAWHTASGYTPKPGDLAIQKGEHVNIVTKVEGGKITLVGGNQGGTNGFSTSLVTEYSISSSTGSGIDGYVSPTEGE